MQIENWLSVRDDGLSAMDRLFNRFDGMYPSLWAKNFARQTNIDNWVEAWAEAFAEDGITFDEVMDGIRACRKSHQYPQTLPEFLQLCRVPIDYDKAFFEAVIQMGIRRRPSVKLVDGEVVQEFGKDVWSNPAIYWAAVAMGKDLDLIYRDVRSRWHYELDRAIKGDKKPVPQSTNLLPEKPVNKVLSEEEKTNVENIFKNLHSMFDEKPVAAPKENAKAVDALEKAKQLLNKN